mmetsp:Transcript_21022/g.39454  ORF Transcript_21022/g.39454 Transcript_21022/m.39454 type:complete len:376 (-) Transcript_21022:431-1558(-)
MRASPARPSNERLVRRLPSYGALSEKPSKRGVDSRGVRLIYSGLGALVFLLAAFALLNHAESVARIHRHLQTHFLTPEDQCADSGCCAGRYGGNPMIGQASMFDDTCPFGTPLDGGMDCIGGDKCRWCCTLPLDARCSNQMFICRKGPTREPTPEPTLQPTVPPSKKPTSPPSPAPSQTRNKKPSTTNKHSSSSSSATPPIPSHVKSSNRGGEMTSTASTSPPTPSNIPRPKSSPPTDSSHAQRHRLGASVGVAIAILGALSLALCITCCERYFRKPRTCCCCFVQFSFTRTSLGETLCCKRVCIVMRADKKSGHGDGQNNHFSDDGSFSDSHPCEPVSKAVNLGKDMVGYAISLISFCPDSSVICSNTTQVPSC